MKIRNFDNGGQKTASASFIDLDGVGPSGELLLLWSTPIYLCQHNQAASSWDTALKEEIEQRAKGGREFRADWRKSDFMRWEGPGVVGFREYLRFHIEARIAHELPLISSTHLEWNWNGWVNDRTGSAWHAPHIHEKSTLSFIYYVKAPDIHREMAIANAGRGEVSDGVLQFLDPRGASPYMSCEVIDNVLSSAVRIIPRPGLLVIFPSFLSHFVAPAGKIDRRVSVAGNVFQIRCTR
jgi:hypothetical protein